MVSDTIYQLRLLISFDSDTIFRKSTPTPFSVDAQPVQAVAQGPEGDAEELGGRGLVEARGFEGLHDRLALDGVEEVAQRQAAGAQRPVERGRAVLWSPLREVPNSHG